MKRYKEEKEKLAFYFTIIITIVIGAVIGSIVAFFILEKGTDVTLSETIIHYMFGIVGGAFIALNILYYTSETIDVMSQLIRKSEEKKKKH